MESGLTANIIFNLEKAAEKFSHAKKTSGNSTSPNRASVRQVKMID